MIPGKQTKEDTFNEFCQIAESYGVCDSMKNGGGHNRIRMGRDGNAKPRFLGCSRNGYMKIYYDKVDKETIETLNVQNISFAGKDEPYDLRCDLFPNDFTAFLSNVSQKLGRKQNASSLSINSPMPPKRIILNEDNSINYQCPRCDSEFRQAKRCPECGQLIKE